MQELKEVNQGLKSNKCLIIPLIFLKFSYLILSWSFICLRIRKREAGVAQRHEALSFITYMCNTSG